MDLTGALVVWFMNASPCFCGGLPAFGQDSQAGALLGKGWPLQFPCRSNGSQLKSSISRVWEVESSGSSSSSDSSSSSGSGSGST